MVYMSLYTCTALNCFDCASNLRWRDTPLSILSNTESYSMLTHTVLHVVCCHTPPVTPVTRDTPAIASRVARDRHTAPRDRPCMRIAHHPPTQPTMHRYKNTHTWAYGRLEYGRGAHTAIDDRTRRTSGISSRAVGVFFRLSARPRSFRVSFSRASIDALVRRRRRRRGGIRARRVGDIFRGASSGDVRWRRRARGWTRARPPMVARGRIRIRGAFA